MDKKKMCYSFHLNIKEVKKNVETEPVSIKEVKKNVETEPVRRKNSKRKQRVNPYKNYAVEKVLAKKEENGFRYYLIKWEGYSSDENSWEPAYKMDCPKLIQEFEDKLKQTNKLNSKNEEVKKNVETEPVRRKNSKRKQRVNPYKNYAVEKVLAKKEENGFRYYLIKWEGYSSDENSWEPAYKMDCPKLIQEFEDKLKQTNKLNSKNEEVKKNVETEPVRRKNSKRKQRVNPYKNYAVEKVLAKKEENGFRYYLIKWEGYSSDENSWELAYKMDCPKLIQEFEENLQRAAQLNSDQRGQVLETQPQTGTHESVLVTSAGCSHWSSKRTLKNSQHTPDKHFQKSENSSSIIGFTSDSSNPRFKFKNSHHAYWALKALRDSKILDLPIDYDQIMNLIISLHPEILNNPMEYELADILDGDLSALKGDINNLPPLIFHFETSDEEI